MISARSPYWHVRLYVHTTNPLAKEIRVFIGVVDDALERFVRARLESDPADVSVEAPTSHWVAQLSRPTVNLHLRQVGRSSEQVRAPQRRFDANGRPERRAAPVHMIDLRYDVTAWAPDAATEHRLLGRVVSLFAALTTIPAEFVADSMSTPIIVSFGALDSGEARSGVDATKAVATLTLSAAADAVEGDEAPEPRPVRAVPIADR